MSFKTLPVISQQQMLDIWNDPKFNLQQCVGKPLNVMPNDYYSAECDCKPDADNQLCSPFNSNCANRGMKIECDTNTGSPENPHHCLNQGMQQDEKNIYEASLICEWNDQKGIIVKCALDIPPNVFVIQYTGRLVTSKEYDNLRKTKYATNFHYYGLSLGYQDVIVDATECGNRSRFISHSCDGNLECFQWTSDGRYKVGLFSKKAIPALEELTFNYKPSGDIEFEHCFCGSAICKKPLLPPLVAAAASDTARDPQQPLAAVVSSPLLLGTRAKPKMIPSRIPRHLQQKQQSSSLSSSSSLPKRDTRLSTQNACIEQLKMKAKGLEDDLKKMTVKCQNLEDSNNLLKFQLQTKEEECKQLIANHNPQLEDMQAQNVALEVKKEKYKERLSKAETAHQIEVVKLQKEISRLNKLVNEGKDA